MLFAAPILEYEPLKWADTPALLLDWVRDYGPFATAALAVVVVATVIRRIGLGELPAPRFLLPLPFRVARALPPRTSRIWPSWQPKVLVTGLLLALFAYGLAGLCLIVKHPTPAATARWVDIASWISFAGSACALLAVAVPVAVDVPRWRWRRIWALAKLSFKEAIRRRILWVFASLTLLFLFYTWFRDTKPEYQVRNYVIAIYWVMTPLLLITASLVGAFSLPADIKNQTIHTIVTKPVQRFEIVLGRFLGYSALMTMVLVVMVLFCLLYLFREIDPEAAKETERARMPLYAETLTFPGTHGEKGESAGDELEYRRYVMGGPQSIERGLWKFQDVPSRLRDRQSVPCEFSFSVFRTHKGEEGKGLKCTFTFLTWRARDNGEGPDRPVDDPLDLPRKYGIFQQRSREIKNFHTESIDVPGELFQNQLVTRQELRQRIDELSAKQEKTGRLSPADEEELGYLKEDETRLQEWESQGQKRPPLQVKIRCEDAKQLIGAARHDLYFLEGEGSFPVNFLKGAVGLWFRLCLVIGIAVACSTYLNGVISWMVTMFLLVGGLFLPFIRDVAAGTNWGGGPMQSFLLLGKGQVSPLQQEKTPTVLLAIQGDNVYRWILNAGLNIIPDVNRFDLKDFVAHGFDIPWAHLTLNLLYLASYLLLWAMLAYYLIKAREVANPT
jgi:hypothetical protein